MQLEHHDKHLRVHSNVWGHGSWGFLEVLKATGNKKSTPLSDDRKTKIANSNIINIVFCSSSPCLCREMYKVIKSTVRMRPQVSPSTSLILTASRVQRWIIDLKIGLIRYWHLTTAASTISRNPYSLRVMGTGENLWGTLQRRWSWIKIRKLFPSTFLSLGLYLLQPSPSTWHHCLFSLELISCHIVNTTVLCSSQTITRPEEQ